MMTVEAIVLETACAKSFEAKVGSPKVGALIGTVVSVI
jgi:hypothetical protein